MKLSTAVLAASAVEADFPWSACYQNGNPAICAKSCQSKLLWRAVKRDMYGSDSWIYKVMGTEKLDKTEAKASYRNVAHFDEKTCTTESLTTLYQALRQSSRDQSWPDQELARTARSGRGTDPGLIWIPKNSARKTKIELNQTKGSHIRSS